jgi:Family of unknown function (DUF5640)
VEVKTIEKRIIILGICALFICIGLSGCDQISNLFLSDEGRIIGTWDATWGIMPVEFVFSTNGTVKSIIDLIEFQYSSEGTWEISEGKLTLEIGDFIPSTKFTYQFSENDKTLTLTTLNGDATYELIKQ